MTNNIKHDNVCHCLPLCTDKCICLEAYNFDVLFNLSLIKNPTYEVVGKSFHSIGHVYLTENRFNWKERIWFHSVKKRQQRFRAQAKMPLWKWNLCSQLYMLHSLCFNCCLCKTCMSYVQVVMLHATRRIYPCNTHHLFLLTPFIFRQIKLSWLLLTWTVISRQTAILM